MQKYQAFIDISEKGAKCKSLIMSAGNLIVLEPALSPTFTQKNHN
jgi:hypothetical protein